MKKLTEEELNRRGILLKEKKLEVVDLLGGIVANKKRAKELLERILPDDEKDKPYDADSKRLYLDTPGFLDVIDFIKNIEWDVLEAAMNVVFKKLEGFEEEIEALREKREEDKLTPEEKKEARLRLAIRAGLDAKKDLTRAFVVYLKNNDYKINEENKKLYHRVL